MATAFLWYTRLLCVCYAFGASVHAGNLLGFGKYKRGEMPAALLAADVFYLVANVVTIIGLLRGDAWGKVSLFVMVGSQFVLYLGFPHVFAETDQERQQLRGMLWFHVVTMALFMALWLLSNRD